MTTPRCALVARDTDEPLPGTAAAAQGWLLVEDLGPLGRDGLVDGTLPAPVRDRLVAALDGQPVRHQAIRRPDRRPEARGRRTVVLAHSGGAPWAVRRSLRASELAEVDPTLALAPTPPGEPWEPVAEPLVLVCTHAKRDACCAIWGRPVVAAFAAVAPAATWETSHTGGHRFAASVLVLPHGHALGHVAADRAAEVVADLRAGSLPLDLLRGRSDQAPPEQAADVAARRELGLRGLGDTTVGPASVAGGEATVVVTVPDGREVTVRLRHDALAPRPVSCGAEPTDPGTWRVVAVEA